MKTKSYTANVYFELKVKDCYGDVWSTGVIFKTFSDAKDFITGNDVESRRAARRNAESLSGVKFSKKNPCVWQVDRVESK